MRKDNHQPGQDKENHRRMRDLVPDPLDAVEQFLQKCLWRFGGFLYGHNAPLLTHIRQPLRELQSKIELFIASCCICSKSAAGPLLKVVSAARVLEPRPRAWERSRIPPRHFTL